MKHSIKPSGVCASKINFTLDGNIVTDISFENGCDGNLKAISILAQGQTVEALTNQLSGICCGRKKTSCSDQLVKALAKAQAEEAKA
ncbi:MAG: TIGR03905 family TSCPD domain-containing protein [Anaerovoracaceae bacterium]